MKTKPVIVSEAIEHHLNPLNAQNTNSETKPAIDKTLSNLSTHPAPVPNTIALADDTEEIERETNVLMELLRQRSECDRKAKLERKEQKEFQSKKTVSSDEPAVAIEIEKKPLVIKLSNPHQATLKALFEEKPEGLRLIPPLLNI